MNSLKKAVFLVICCVSFSTLSFAQNKKADALKDRMAQEVCDCISSSDVDFEDGEALKLKLGLCLMQSIGENQNQIQKVGIDIENEENITRFGEDIGLAMATKCPAVFMGFAKKELEEKRKSNKDEEVKVQALTGTITKVEEEAFVTIVVKDEEGRSHNMLWLEFFENSEELKENYSNLTGKDVSIEYYEKEYYNPKIEDYVKVKVLRRVDFE
ncbi:hypothetical protein [Bernardetia sp.]|uniref:hypothetical protein n=1 Tax=Bernardetia sp. TaxID=1937974 RepID=UPI0025C14FD4|nr:hypothetical protein [Bernardetia sp.]